MTNIKVTATEKGWKFAATEIPEKSWGTEMYALTNSVHKTVLANFPKGAKFTVEETVASDKKGWSYVAHIDVSNVPKTAENADYRTDCEKALKRIASS